MGSGGSYIGQVIASRLGIKYVDREVLHFAAKEFGCDEETIAARSERLSSFWERILKGLTLGIPESRYVPPPIRSFSDEELFEKQTEILKRIATKDDCVVIGWAGVHILAQHQGMFSMFCHAPTAFRIKRVMQIYDIASPEEARARIEESDEKRKRYFQVMTEHEWSCAADYHLAIDTSLLPLDQIAEMVINIVKNQRKGEQGKRGTG